MSVVERKLTANTRAGDPGAGSLIFPWGYDFNGGYFQVALMGLLRKSGVRLYLRMYASFFQRFREAFSPLFIGSILFHKYPIYRLPK